MSKHRAAIVGVGSTTFSRDSGVSCLDMAVTAIEAAMRDSGVDRASINGLLSYSLGDSVPVTTVARTLGVPALAWHNDVYGGGSQCASILWEASNALEQGLANVVVIYRAVKSASKQRMGQISLGAADGNEAQFVTPYGLKGPVNLFALTANRWLYERGHEAEQLADVVIAQRRMAGNNERALFRGALSRDDYLAAPMIASPLRRLDCCRETDGAVAMVLCRESDLSSAQHRPVFLRAAVRGGGKGGTFWDKAESLESIFSRHIADHLYRQAGISSEEIDLAMLYDAYSFLVPAQMEDFGFCKRGEALAFIASGETGANGSLPVNTNGGLLSEGYVHGLNNTMEAVVQLRGKAGVRQVEGVKTALVSGFGGRYGAAAVLANE